MNHQKSELYFLLVLLVGIFILTFLIFKPFLYALILAIVFAIIFEPVHKKALTITHQKKSLAALLATISVLVVVIAPLAFLGVQIFQEATQLYLSIAKNGGATDFARVTIEAVKNLKTLFPIPVEFSFDFNQYLKQGAGWLLEHLGLLFTNIAKIILGAFVFIIALYYLFKDGQKLKNAIVVLSPLQVTHNEIILQKLELAVNSVIKGNLVVALAQGILTSIGFAIFGVPSAILWGSMAAIAALVPGIGTALVIIPAIIYLFLSAKTFFALGLLLWGTLAVGLVDNFLGPKLVGQGTQIHSFFILLSVFGGISFFGPIGFLLGPLALSLLFAFLAIYLAISKEHKDQLI